jgi:pimeloyl-ACP methyl ester carboxylesterase
MGHADPKVLMVHGSAQGSEVTGEKHFAAQSRLAIRGWQIVVPDRPGHGRSPSRGLPDDADIDGKWVADLLCDGAHLVGHSFGGAVALTAAALRLASVKSLTLVEPAMQVLTIDNPHTQAFVGQIAQAMMAGSPAETAKGFIKVAGIPSELRGEATPELLEKLGRGLLSLKLPTEEALRSRLDAVKKAKIPLLVVSGDWNPSISATARKVAELGGGRYAVIKSEHHFPQLISDEFNDMLEGHMMSVEKVAA